MSSNKNTKIQSASSKKAAIANTTYTCLSNPNVHIQGNVADKIIKAGRATAVATNAAIRHAEDRKDVKLLGHVANDLKLAACAAAAACEDASNAITAGSKPKYIPTRRRAPTTNVTYGTAPALPST